MSRAIEENTLPSAIREKLQSVRWRAAGFASARAFAIAISVLLVAMVAAMMADWWFTIFDTRVRVFLTTVSLSLTIVALVYFGLRPLIEAFGWTTAAKHVDAEIPQLEERWTTVANFANSGHQPKTGTEKAMLQQVRSEAVAMGSLVKPQAVVRPVSLKRPAIALTGVMLGFAVFLASNWGQTSVLLQRFWQPTAAITATQLKPVTGDAIIPRGHSVDLVTKLEGLPRVSATFIMESEGYPPEEIALKPDEEQPGVFVCKVDVDESFRYRLQSGDGRTEWHTVTAIDFPSLAEVKLTVTAPEYVGQDPIEKSLIPGRLKVIQGSVLSLAMKPAAKLTQFELRLASAGGKDESKGDVDSASRETLTLNADSGGWYRFEMPLMEDFSFSHHLLNEHGLENEESRVCRIHVVEDKAPVARVITPNDEMAVSPDEEIEIKFEAHDDHGIATAELVIYDESNTKEGEEPKVLAVKEIPLGDQTLQKHVMARTKLDLKEFGLEDGANISYSIRVTDNRMVDIDPNDVRKATSSEAGPDEEKKASDSAVAKSDKNPADKLAKADTASNADKPASEQNDATDKTGEGSEASPNDISNMLADASKDTVRTAKDGNTESDSNDLDDSDKPKSDRTQSAPADGQQDTGNEDAVAASENGDPSKKADTPTVAAESGRNQLLATNDMPAESSDSALADNAAASKDDQDKQNVSGPASEKKDDEKKPADTAVASNESPTDSPASTNGAPMSESNETLEDMKVAEKPETDAANKAENAETSNSGEEAIVASNAPNDGQDKQNSASGNAQAGQPNDDSKASESGEKESDTKSLVETSRRAPKESKAADNNSPNGNSDGSKASKSNSPNGGGNRNNDQKKPSENNSMRSPIRRMAQNNEDGQRRETNRRRLNIKERLFAVASADDERRKQSGKIRDRVVKIDEMLAVVEGELGLLVDKAAPEAERSDRYRQLDTDLGEIETYIADLRIETKDDKFAFVGLQMVDIGRTHVTPARDRVFVSIREPDVAPDTHAKEGLHHVISARELLDDLLKKYDRVVRDQELAEKLEEAMTMYEVYVEETQRLMREARQNKNPLKRKMDVIEVDQAYLDRYAEVLTMRREMMAEFGRILADDPRLLARYMDLIKRRRTSLRDQLSELFERQEDISEEVSGWQRVNEAQRDNLWMLVSELRLQAASPLAKDAEALAERIQKQMPLILDASRGTAALVIAHAKRTALLSRASALDAKKAIKASGDPNAKIELSPNANLVVFELSELAAALDQLNFESEDKEGVTEYVNARLAESRAIADQADAWAETAGFIETHTYHGLAQVDQQQAAIATEVLRVEMLNIETELEGEFRDVEMPQEVRNLARELNRVMEAITFNQSAAAFALSKNDINRAADQQERSLDGFELAEDLFDRLRRKTIEVLDEVEGRNPTAADLQDPTLDEFLARLEREPNIDAQLGIPNRPRNLRILADTMTWQQNGGAMLGDSSNAAAQRARKEMMAKLKRRDKKQEDKEPREMSEEEKKEREAEKQAQKMLQEKMTQTVKELEEKAAAQKTSEDDRQKLREKAEHMKRMLQQMRNGEIPDDAWDKLAESEEAAAMLKALAQGQTLPDTQWNKLMSSLNDGLWQVRTRTPPEDYRRTIEQYQEAIRRLTTIGADDE